jgi:hypothetical protein
MAAQTQQLEPTHRAYSTPSEGGGTRMCLGFAYAHKDGRGFDVKLHAFPAEETSPVGPLPNGARRAASFERRGRAESRTHLGAERDPFWRSDKQRAASSGGSFICCTQTHWK